MNNCTLIGKILKYNLKYYYKLIKKYYKIKLFFDIMDLIEIKHDTL